MPFDLASAQPVDSGGFDLASATPVKKPVRSLDRLADGTLALSGSPAAQDDRDPAMNMSAIGRFGAGYGKAGADLARGAGQLIGAVSRQDVQNARDRDAALMNTGAGRAGNLVGSIADMAPAALVPGANTLGGAAGIGALMGLLQPSTSTGETAANVGLGGAAGPASLLAGRAVGAVAKGAKASLWDPFTKPGQERIAANVLQNFAGGPQEAQAAAAALAKPPQVLPGVTPTTAELAGNAGLAQLQKTLSSNPELMQDFAARAQGNRQAMVGALGNIAGTPGDKAAAEAARDAVTGRMYRAANNVMVNSDDKLEAIMRRPSMQQAWTRAQQLAQERGDTLMRPGDPSPFAGAAGAALDTSVPQYSGKAIQYLKMALNDITNSGPQMGMGSHELGAVKSTLGALNDWTAANVPKLRGADRVYAGLSRPINQMDAGQALSNKLLPSLSDYGANTGMNGATFATALRNEGQGIAASVTGRQGQSLADILSGQQMDTLKKIGEQLARADNAAKLGAPKGSPTAQNLISQNVLGQFLGPLGLPNNMAGRIAGGAFGRTIGRPIQFLGSAAQPDVMRVLSQAALDPATAAKLLTAVQRPGIGQALWNRQGLLGTSGNAIAQGLLGDSRGQ